VYQAFGAEDRLLYVGKSWDLKRRLEDHRRYTSWWHEVERVEHEWFDNQWIAADIETYLIRTADPVHNIQCRGGRLQRNPTRGPQDATH
jgi:excinuclease UvrABC nuclease subunit